MCDVHKNQLFKIRELLDIMNKIPYIDENIHQSPTTMEAVNKVIEEIYFAREKQIMAEARLNDVLSQLRDKDLMIEELINRLNHYQETFEKLNVLITERL